MVGRIARVLKSVRLAAAIHRAGRVQEVAEQRTLGLALRVELCVRAWSQRAKKSCAAAKMRAEAVQVVSRWYVRRRAESHRASLVLAIRQRDGRILPVRKRGVALGDLVRQLAEPGCKLSYIARPLCAIVTQSQAENAPVGVYDLQIGNGGDRPGQWMLWSDGTRAMDRPLAQYWPAPVRVVKYAHDEWGKIN